MHYGATNPNLSVDEGMFIALPDGLDPAWATHAWKCTMGSFWEAAGGYFLEPHYHPVHLQLCMQILQSN